MLERALSYRRPGPLRSRRRAPSTPTRRVTENTDWPDRRLAETRPLDDVHPRRLNVPWPSRPARCDRGRLAPSSGSRASTAPPRTAGARSRRPARAGRAPDEEVGAGTRRAPSAATAEVRDPSLYPPARPDSARSTASAGAAVPPPASSHPGSRTTTGRPACGPGQSRRAFPTRPKRRSQRRPTRRRQGCARARSR